ncbi:MAG: type II secretion system protein [Oscillospiraceae bacterium]
MKKSNINKLRGFTLVELVTVIAIICVLSAMIVPSLMQYIEYANNKVDVANARRIYTILQEAMAFDINNSIDYSNPWGNKKEDKDHGYVYVDDDEIRTSSIKIAKILAGQGIIDENAVKNPNMRQGKEPQFSKNKINLTCKSKKTWDRYQVNFVLVGGEVVFSYSACRNGRNKDKEASENFAERIGGFAGSDEISLGGKS